MTLPELARASMAHWLETGKLMAAPADAPAEWARPAGAFVSLHAGDSLRGCIGTIHPARGSLTQEVIENAVAAATRDPRFEAVTAGELAGLAVSVDVLSEPMPEPDLERLDPKRFGVIVRASDGRQGVLLPDLDGVNSVEEQLAICRDKAGIGPDEPIEAAKFEVKRYEQ